MDEIAVVEKLPTPMRAVRVISGVVDTIFEAERDAVSVAIGVVVGENVDIDDGLSRLCAGEIVGTIETVADAESVATAVEAAEST
jgi:hypothetical protein